MSVLKIRTAEVFEPLLEPARYKGAWGGRGSGKSHFFAEALVEKALLQPGLRWVCIREVQKSLEQSVKRLIEDKIESLGVGGQFEVLEREIRTPGGGLILFQGMQNHTADSIKSLEGYHGAWVEEAQSLSQRSLDLLRPTIREEGSELWFTWNPRHATDPVNAFLRSKETPPGSIVVEANWQHNPWFPEVLRQEMEWDRRRDPDKYAHIWGGGYERKSEARVFKNWRIDEFETPTDARLYFGADWGFSVDPSVLVRMFLRGRSLYIDQEAYAVGCEIDDTPALFAGTDDREPARWTNPLARKGIAGATKWPITADSARPETISYMKRRGFRVQPAKKGAGSVEEGVEFLKSYDIVVHPRCVHTIDELTNYCFKTDKLTGEVIPVLEDKKNHVIDAVRYALEGVRNGASTMDGYA